MVIAVDFDGTIVEHRYPRIGEEIPFAIDTLKLMQQEKHRLILWSVREGALLDEAVPYHYLLYYLLHVRSGLIRIILKNKKIIRVFPGN